jgi:hypothetical protein
MKYLLMKKNIVNTIVPFAVNTSQEAYSMNIYCNSIGNDSREVVVDTILSSAIRQPRLAIDAPLGESCWTQIRAPTEPQQGRVSVSNVHEID